MINFDTMHPAVQGGDVPSVTKKARCLHAHRPPPPQTRVAQWHTCPISRSKRGFRVHYCDQQKALSWQRKHLSFTNTSNTTSTSYELLLYPMNFVKFWRLSNYHMPKDHPPHHSSLWVRPVFPKLRSVESVKNHHRTSFIGDVYSVWLFEYPFKKTTLCSPSGRQSASLRLDHTMHGCVCYRYVFLKCLITKCVARGRAKGNMRVKLTILRCCTRYRSQCL